MSATDSIGSVFESFYTRHILRDLLGKMAPGALVLVGVRVATWSAHQAIQDMKEANLGAWLVFAAVAWLAGLGLQGIGEISGRWCRYFPVQYCTREKGKSRNEAEAEFQAKLTMLDSNTGVTTEQRQRFERLVLIKEAAGNACLALLTLIAIVLTARWPELFRLAPGLGLAVVACAGFWRLHFDNVRRQDELLAKIIEKTSQRVGT